MTDFFTTEEPKEDKVRLSRDEIGPWIRCRVCHSTMQHWKLVHGVKWTIKLERDEDGWLCQFCK